MGKRGGVLAWLEERLPIRLFIETQLTGYFAPKNFRFWYYFGVLALVLLVLQYTTGVFLTILEPADPLSTPGRIAPAWYFTPYYAILRAIPDQRIGA